MAAASKFSAEEQKKLFAQLAVPFDPAEIKWRVMRTAGNGRRGAILPFADPRAYTDRLNQIFTPAGWTRTYTISTVSALGRVKDGRIIPTGKVLVASVVTIHQLASHTGSGEEWADQENAVTAADAQAFKRACSCFGLGRYLYRFAETWVSLNHHGGLEHLPSLPQWALPPGLVAASAHPSSPDSVKREDVRGPIDHQLTSTIESFRQILGEPIYAEILKRAGHSRTARAIPNAERQRSVVEWMETASRGIRRIHALAEMAGEAQFIAIMNELRIASTNTILNLAMLKRLVESLEAHTQQQVA
ncbi:MAG: Rad52/Rad22 family DNA repair protein [Acidobacteriaceae bacterium]